MFKGDSGNALSNDAEAEPRPVVTQCDSNVQEQEQQSRQAQQKIPELTVQYQDCERAVKPSVTESKRLNA
jgi:hypothetical protein